MRLFVFGYGYSAAAAVDRLRARCTWIGATARSADKAAALKAAGIEPFPFDGSAPGAGIREALAAADRVLVTAGPGAAGDPVLNRHAADLSLARRLRGLVYLSTVGVYGDHRGMRVDERTAPKPVSDRSRGRLQAEERWQRLGEEGRLPVAILRLSGIYGPGRNALANLAEGTARRIVKPGQVFNRIHVDDIAAAVDLCFARGAAGIFNVTDDEPAPPQDVVAFAASLMGVAPPPEIPFESADLSAMARSFYGENKRVANGKSKRELGLAYAYPTYREGLRALWEADRWRAPPVTPSAPPPRSDA